MIGDRSARAHAHGRRERSVRQGLDEPNLTAELPGHRDIGVAILIEIGGRQTHRIVLTRPDQRWRRPARAPRFAEENVDLTEEGSEPHEVHEPVLVDVGRHDRARTEGRVPEQLSWLEGPAERAAVLVPDESAGRDHHVRVAVPIDVRGQDVDVIQRTSEVSAERDRRTELVLPEVLPGADQVVILRDGSDIQVAISIEVRGDARIRGGHL